jgi:hypothetical protein
MESIPHQKKDSVTEYPIQARMSSRRIGDVVRRIGDVVKLLSNATKSAKLGRLAE